MLAGCASEGKKQFQQAEEDLEAGAYEEAISGYEKVLEGQEYLAEAYRGIGIAYYEMGEYLKASDAFQNALNQPETGKGFQRDVLLYQASACYLGEMYENAADSCSQALELKEDATGWFLSGKIALERDAYEEASASFEEAYGKDSSYEMTIQIYQAYVDRDMEADGTAYLERALEDTPKKAEDYCERGRIYYYMEDYANAQKELTEAVNEGSQEGKLLLGDVYLAQKDLANARAMYQDYIDVETGAALGYNGLALCEIEEGDYVEALDYVEKGLRAAEEDEIQGLLFNEAIIYEKRMDFPTALEKFQDYLKIYPGDEAARKEFIFLKSRTGNISSGITEEAQAPQETDETEKVPSDAPVETSEDTGQE